MTATYSAAGVNLAAADAVVESIEEAVKATWGNNVVGGFGGFAGGFRIPPGYQDPVLMMSTDGIGTKLDLARKAGRLDEIGYDLVAMVVDDLAAVGAEPLVLTDYIAVGKLDSTEVAAVVRSIARACAACGVALIGGETAEHPGTLPNDALDVAAAAVGVVEAGDMMDPAAVIPGDLVVGVASPNVRSNGFSLVRAILEGLDADESIEGDPVLDVVLEPSFIYAPAAIAARDKVKVYAHITGGGLASNLARVLPDDVEASLDESTWTPPPIFAYLAHRGSVTHDEMRRVFNMGIGFVAIAEPSAAPAIRAAFEEHGHATSVIGSIAKGNGGVGYTTEGHDV